MSSPAQEPSRLRGPVSVMQLEYDEEDEEGDRGRGCTEQAEVPQEQTHTEENKSVRSSRAPPTSAENPAPRDPDWDAGQNQLVLKLVLRQTQRFQSHLEMQISLKLVFAE